MLCVLAVEQKNDQMDVKVPNEKMLISVIINSFLIAWINLFFLHFQTIQNDVSRCRSSIIFDTILPCQWPTFPRQAHFGKYSIRLCVWLGPVLRARSPKRKLTEHTVVR